MDLENQQANDEHQESEKRGEFYMHVDPGTVRRKLFQDESTDNNETCQDFGSIQTICDQGKQMCPSNWSKDRQHESKSKETKSSDKKLEQDVHILLVSQCKDLNLAHQIEERAKLSCGNAAVSHCYPEAALRLCCARTYSLIFLDLNGDNIDIILKLASNIRVSTYSNQATCIVALKHIGTFKDEIWRKFGITEMIYGPLFHTVIDRLLEKWIVSRIKRDQNSSGSDELDKTAASNGTLDVVKQEDDKVIAFHKPILQSAELNFSKPNWSNRNASPSPACDSTDQLSSFNSSEGSNSNTPIQIQDPSSYCNEQATNQIDASYLTGSDNPVPTCSTLYYTSVPHTVTARQLPTESLFENSDAGRTNSMAQTDLNGTKVNSGWNMIQQILDLHQSGQKAPETRQKHENITPATCKAPSGQPVTTPYQTATQAFVKTLTGHPLYTPPTIPSNTAYMINGTPGTSDMRISLIPDEYAKHSNKERERRERIKESCDELRKILPKQLVAGRRQDMATILEFTVQYLKAVQNHLPTVIQQQLYQSFMTQNEVPLRRKRKSSELTPAASYVMSHKQQRIQSSSSSMIHGCPLATYTGPTYLPQVLPGNMQQPTTLTYFSSIYHPIISNPYLGSLTPSPSPTAFGNGPNHGSHLQYPQLDYSMHSRQLFYNEMSSQNGMPCYLAMSSASRDVTGNAAQKDLAH